MVQTILISLFTGIFSYTFWFSYSLFLIFIGGILILFIYITSLASNETFKLSINHKLIIFYFLIFCLIILLYYIFDFKNITIETKKINTDKNSFFILKTLIENNKIILNKMFNFPINITTILLVFYLFLTLIISVKITNIFKGPIRTK
jgi:NADH-ubiquinone oxidoreductase chain 6